MFVVVCVRLCVHIFGHTRVDVYHITRCRRNEGGDEHINHFPTLSVFAPQGTVIGRERSRYLTDVEYVAAYLHGS